MNGPVLTIEVVLQAAWLAEAVINKDVTHNLYLAPWAHDRARAYGLRHGMTYDMPMLPVAGAVVRVWFVKVDLPDCLLVPAVRPLLAWIPPRLELSDVGLG